MKSNARLNNKIETIKSLELQVEALKNRIESLKKEIKDYMGEDEVLEYKDVTLVTYKTSIRRSFDTSSFKKEHIDLYSKFLKEQEIRTFLIK